MKAMAKRSQPPPSAPSPRRRGRPPKAGGAISHVEAQRAYRARLKAAGKGVRTVRLDAVPAGPAQPLANGGNSAEMPDFDPATQIVWDRAMFEDMRNKLHHALLQIELRDERLKEIEQRNAWLEGELKLQERQNTNSLKEIITLRQQLAKQR